MAKIQITGEESLKEALRRFKKICVKEGILIKSKRDAYYEKPSDRRRREENRRLKNIKKAQKTPFSNPIS